MATLPGSAEASLVVVGAGIKTISHLTAEAKAYIEQSDKVLYLLNEPAMKAWVESVNANAESLDHLYARHALRDQTYSAITDHILEVVNRKQHVCVVLYGHPAVFARPALDAVTKARQQGLHAFMLPGISAEDCLFADLLIDPATHGCLSLEATDLLIRQRQLDVSCHVILWQVSVIGMMGHDRAHDNRKGMALLDDYLRQYYPPGHELTVYAASQYPGLQPTIIKFALSELRDMTFSRVSTLYIPPLTHPVCDSAVLAQLGIQ